LKIRVINVVDLMRLQPDTEHPHGLSDIDYNALFTSDKPIIFAFHGYPWLIHRIIYRRTNQRVHVRGYKEEGTITTAFDMTVKNQLDRFHLVMDVIERAHLSDDAAQTLYEDMQKKLIQHNNYIVEHGQDLAEVREWVWPFGRS
jgi:xylulose-5-phosphate/fructose-6-phosphate phosphoketolase